jgi:uncharacterized membrane protein
MAMPMQGIDLDTPGYAADTGSDALPVRRIGYGDLTAALAEGWADFTDKRGDILFIGLVYPVVGLLACMAAFNASLLPVIFPLAAGIALLGPAVALGFYEISRRREAGEDASWQHFSDVLNSPAIGSIAALTGLLAVLYALWIAVAWVIYTLTLGVMPPADVGEFVSRLFTTSEGWTMIVVGNLVGAAFAVVALAVSVVSFPLLLDRNVTPRAAVATSVRAVRENPGVMTGWGLIVAGLLVLGSIPLFVGLCVVLPVLGYATWHLYRRVVP